MRESEIAENIKKYSDIDSCPIRNVVARFSGKWSMLVLCLLSENVATRFSAIGKAVPDISPKVLTETLRSLEAAGLINRHQYGGIPPRVEYSLTDLGRSLMPHINGLIGWAAEHFDAIASR